MTFLSVVIVLHLFLPNIGPVVNVNLQVKVEHRRLRSKQCSCIGVTASCLGGEAFNTCMVILTKNVDVEDLLHIHHYRV